MHESTPPPKNQRLSRTGRPKSAQQLQQLPALPSRSPTQTTYAKRPPRSGFLHQYMHLSPTIQVDHVKNHGIHLEHSTRAARSCTASYRYLNSRLRHGEPIGLITAPRRPRPRPPLGGPPAAASATPHVTTPSCPPPRRGAVWCARRYARGLREALLIHSDSCCDREGGARVGGVLQANPGMELPPNF